MSKGAARNGTEETRGPPGTTKSSTKDFRKTLVASVTTVGTLKGLAREEGGGVFL